MDAKTRLPPRVVSGRIVISMMDSGMVPESKLQSPMKNLSTTTRVALAAAVCAATLVSPRHAAAESFGSVCEGALYSGAAAPLVLVGAIGGVAAVAASGYILFDVGEAFYVGFRESGAALQGKDPSEIGGLRNSKKSGPKAWLVSRPKVPADARRWIADLAFDPRAQIGGADVDVLGFRLGILSAENCNVYGLDVCTILGRTLGDEYGVQAGLFNLVDGNVGGLQAGLANLSGDSLLGLQAAGFFNVAGGDSPSYGLQVAGVANRARDFLGLQAGYVDVADSLVGMQVGGYTEADRVAGLQVAVTSRAKSLAGLQVGVANVCFDLDDSSNAGDMSGAQIGVANFCNSGSGLQIGVWNQANHFRGVQLGLVNVIKDHEMPFLPILNAGF